MPKLSRTFSHPLARGRSSEGILGRHCDNSPGRVGGRGDRANGRQRSCNSPGSRGRRRRVHRREWRWSRRSPSKAGKRKISSTNPKLYASTGVHRYTVLPYIHHVHPPLKPRITSRMRRRGAGPGELTAIIGSSPWTPRRAMNGDIGDARNLRIGVGGTTKRRAVRTVH